MSKPAGSSDAELSLKFLFANQDGVHVVLRFSKTLLVADVKAQLMLNWPAGTRRSCVAPADDAKCIRLICMGRGMLQDAQTLEASKVPGFPTHPTPVNVSVLRRAPSSTTAATVKTSSTRVDPPARPTTATNVAPVPDTTPGCGCIIL